MPTKLQVVQGPETQDAWTVKFCDALAGVAAAHWQWRAMPVSAGPDQVEALDGARALNVKLMIGTGSLAALGLEGSGPGCGCDRQGQRQ